MELYCPGLASHILDQIETKLGLLNPTKLDFLPIAHVIASAIKKNLPRKPKRERIFLLR
jgi:hypothetical protein